MSRRCHHGTNAARLTSQSAPRRHRRSVASHTAGDVTAVSPHRGAAGGHVTPHSSPPLRPRRHLLPPRWRPGVSFADHVEVALSLPAVDRRRVRSWVSGNLPPTPEDSAHWCVRTLQVPRSSQSHTACPSSPTTLPRFHLAPFVEHFHVCSVPRFLSSNSSSPGVVSGSGTHTALKLVKWFIHTRGRAHVRPRPRSQRH